MDGYIIVKGVIFDLDGVLTNTSRFHYLAWKRIADELGIHFDEMINERLKGVDRAGSLDIILEKSEKAYRQDEKKQLLEVKNGYYLELLRGISPDDLFPETAKLLAKLKGGGIKLALGSMSKNAYEVIRRLSIGHFFDVIADAGRIGKSKPDPEIFITAAELMGLKCCECAVVEDSAAGIAAAKAAGMTAIGIGNRDCLHSADIVFSETRDMIYCDIRLQT